MVAGHLAPAQPLHHALLAIEGLLLVLLILWVALPGGRQRSGRSGTHAASSMLLVPLLLRLLLVRCSSGPCATPLRHALPSGPLHWLRCQRQWPLRRALLVQHVHRPSCALARDLPLLPPLLLQLLARCLLELLVNKRLAAPLFASSGRRCNSSRCCLCCLLQRCIWPWLRCHLYLILCSGLKRCCSSSCCRCCIRRLRCLVCCRSQSCCWLPLTARLLPSTLAARLALLCCWFGGLYLGRSKRRLQRCLPRQLVRCSCLRC